ncbi:MAG TPA: phage holin family protein [Lacibacter sp.]|nr:phage holin family protein [Lacibacter sp.]HMO90183.1 phage holin family protein [Lacibacter sp.]HMP87000.1 phage holin family protein [Lacibacter sp.]
MNFVIKILITAVNAFALAYLLPGIHIRDFLTAIIVAFVLALLDAVVKPVLILFTLPATIFTLGLFLFVINAIIILMDAYFVGGFEIDPPKFWYALLFSILLSIVNSVVHKMVLKGDRKKTDY